MRTISCDRCGCYIKTVEGNDDFDPSADMVIFAHKSIMSPLHGNSHFDLCEDCKESFLAWFGKDIPGMKKDTIKDPEPKKKRRGEARPSL